MENIRESLDGFALPTPNGVQSNSITETLGWVGLTCILYFERGYLPEVQAGVCECIREYVQILGKEARSCVSLTNRIVLAKKKGLPLPNEEQIRKKQEKGHRFASYIVSSNATREDFYIQPPKCMFDLTLRLMEYNPYFYQGKDISYIFAGFAPSLFLVDEPPIPFAELVLSWCKRLRPVSGAAGWGVTRACGFPASEYVRPYIAPYLLRFPGLNLPTTFPTHPFINQISDINWLTIINEELAARRRPGTALVPGRKYSRSRISRRLCDSGRAQTGNRRQEQGRYPPLLRQGAGFAAPSLSASGTNDVSHEHCSAPGRRHRFYSSQIGPRSQESKVYA